MLILQHHTGRSYNEACLKKNCESMTRDSHKQSFSAEKSTVFCEKTVILLNATGDNESVK